MNYGDIFTFILNRRIEMDTKKWISDEMKRIRKTPFYKPIDGYESLWIRTIGDKKHLVRKTKVRGQSYEEEIGEYKGDAGCPI